MARLTKFLRLPKLLWLGGRTGVGPSPAPPLELVTEDGVYLVTEDGNYLGVPA